MAEEIYGIESLGHSSFRLLTLHPGAFEDPIVCDAKEESLDNPPKYEALSYVWGDPKATSPIKFNGHDWQVTTNLEGALRDLRSKDSTRILWIDALCINQSSKQERTFQVTQMGQIYEAAKDVVAWLGEGSDQQSLAVAAMKICAADQSLHWMPGTTGDRESVEDIDVKFRNGAYVPGVFQILLHPWWRRVWTLQEAVLANKLIFLIGSVKITWGLMIKASRSLASHKTHLRCCRDFGLAYNPRGVLDDAVMGIYPLEDFRRLSKLQLKNRKSAARNAGNLLANLETRYDPRCMQCSNSTKTEGESAKHHVHVHYEIIEQQTKLAKQYAELIQGPERSDAKILEQERSYTEQRDLLRQNYLEKCVTDVAVAPWRRFVLHISVQQNRECYDPRDRIYGSAGLRNICGLKKSIFSPDYSFPPDKIFEDFCLEAILGSKTLDILSLIPPRRAVSEHTWLPRWERNAYGTHNRRSSMSTEIRFKESKTFQAGKQELNDVTFVHPRGLSCHGFVLDLVSEVGQPQLKHNPWRICLDWWSMVDKVGNFSTTPFGEGISMAFFETLMGYSCSLEDMQIENDAPGQKSVVRENAIRLLSELEGRPRMVNTVEPSSNEPPNNPLGNDETSTIGYTEAMVKEALIKPLFGDYRAATLYRRLLISKKGFVGLANMEVEPGDLICILNGGRVPLILRRVNSEDVSIRQYGERPCYRFIGDAYIQGVMYGEAFERLDPCDRMEQEFLLI